MLHIIYTSCFGDYDTPKPAPAGGHYFGDGCWDGWLNHWINIALPPLQAAKRIKVLPQKYLPIHDVSIWVDASTEVIKDPTPLLDYFPADCDMMAFPSQYGRRSIWDEAQACIDQRKAPRDAVERQMGVYAQLGFQGGGLFSGGILFRRNTKKIHDFSHVWWKHLTQFTMRDMLSGPVAATIAGIRYKILDPAFRKEYFKQYPHGGAL